MKPVVGYMGGKRSFAAKIFPHLNLTPGRLYVEPYVGMGAVYLYARSQGWDGPAILNDVNPAVAEFWRCVHRAQLRDLLLEAMQPYVDYERTNAHHKYVASLPVPEKPWEMVARWLWLQSVSFGCKPVAVTPNGYTTYGAKYDTAAQRVAAGQSPGGCVQFATVVRSVRALAPLTSFRAHVTNRPFPFVVPQGAVVYGDPPYEGTTGYGMEHGNAHVRNLAALRGVRVVISEQHATPPEGFMCLDIGTRSSDLFGVTVASDRREVLFVGGVE